MPRYRITNRITRDVCEVEAPFAQIACEQAGWMIGHCYVEQAPSRGLFSGVNLPLEENEQWTNEATRTRI